MVGISSEDLARLPVDYARIIRWLIQARRTEGRLEVPDPDLNRKLPWGQCGICIRSCYAKFETLVMQSWQRDADWCCVLTGTPGIGKSTLLHYLVWKFMHEGILNYQTLVCGDSSCLFYIEQHDSIRGQFRIHLFQDLGHVFEGRSLGLIDAPENCQLLHRTLNHQRVVARLCVDELLIAASAGLMQKHSDLRKATRQRCILPIWQPENLRHWCCDIAGLPQHDWEARVRLCGACVPRLVLGGHVPLPQMAWEQGFVSTLETFVNALVGITLQGLDAAPHDAHALLLLQCSLQLVEEAQGEAEGNEVGETGGEAGEAVGQGEGGGLSRVAPGEMLQYASTYVQQRVHAALLAKDRLLNFLRAIPQAAPFAFEEIALRWLMQDGLEVQGGILKVEKQTWLEDLLECPSLLQLNVVYRPRSRHYPSIDGYAVLMMGTVRTAYLIQITTALRHLKVQSRHVQRLPLASAKTVVCLHVVPGCRELKLKDGDGPLLDSASWRGAECREERVSAEAALAGYPEDLRDIIQGTSGNGCPPAKRART